jgi:hypothetical protein
LNGRVCLDKVEIGPLKDIVDPEQKRMIIGDTFITCKDTISKEASPNFKFDFIRFVFS